MKQDVTQTMIRRTDVTMTREPRMPFATYRCPFCGDSKNVQVAGQRECQACGAPLKLILPRNR